MKDGFHVAFFHARQGKTLWREFREKFRPALPLDEIAHLTGFYFARQLGDAGKNTRDGHAPQKDATRTRSFNAFALPSAPLVWRAASRLHIMKTLPSTIASSRATISHELQSRGFGI